MKKITTLKLYADYGVFRLFDASLNYEDTTHLSDLTFTQGFSWRPGSYNFSVFTSYSYVTIEVGLADKQQEIQIRPDSLRVILLPFWVPATGLMIDDSEMRVQQQIEIDEGEYALLFELKLRNDPEFLKSERYRENVEGGFSEAWCYLTFYPRTEPVQPEILRLDTRSSFPYELQEYSQLKPTYPLVMGGCRSS